MSELFMFAKKRVLYWRNISITLKSPLAVGEQAAQACEMA